MTTSDTGQQEQHAACGLHARLVRSATLQHLLSTYSTDEGVDPHDAPLWEAWLARTGELPPDFDSLPTIAGLPDLLMMADGRPVASAAEWPGRRQELLALLEHYQLGPQPPLPGALVIEEHAVSVDAAGQTQRSLVLVYGPDAKAVRADQALVNKDPAMYRSVRLRVEVTIPPGPGPFPALVTLGRRQGDRLVGWLGAQAAARGYVVCAFEREDAFAARDVYPGQEWTELGWWAYAASRCADYIAGLEIVRRDQIAICGHSRGAKMALIAAALDDRFAAAVISHAGSGAGMTEPWRYIGEKYGGETLEYSTRVFPYWNHPRLRFFAGRENKLPFDAHAMVALVAPRALLMTEGDADDVGETWGAQQSYLAAKPVWALLGREDGLSIAFHSGGHRLAADVLTSYVDWLDMQLGLRPLAWPNELMYPYTFDAWRAITGAAVDPTAFPVRDVGQVLLQDDGALIASRGAWDARRPELQSRLAWVLGELPALGPTDARLEPAAEHDGLCTAMLRLPGALEAQLTYPASARGPLPVVIYLHAHLDTCGRAWSAEYGWTPAVGERLAQRGFMAVEFDQFGYGRRNREDVLGFYRDHPTQSVLGAMIQDVRRVINALSVVSVADTGRIAVTGYSLGGLVAVFSAAVDERIGAVASVCGLGSLRRDAHGDATEGLQRYSHLRPLLPRLGFFVGHEQRAPIDFDELLALIAPRPALVLAPTLDQDWFPEDVAACCQAAQPVYALLGAPQALRLETPHDFNRYPPKYQDIVNAWLAGALGVNRLAD